MSPRVIRLAGREDDCSTEVRAQVLRYTDSGSRALEVDVDDGGIGLAIAHVLQRLARRVCGTQHHVTRIFEHRGGTVGNNRFILDH
jgi:hypothetical protein